jgi:hypothetical protein
VLIPVLENDAGSGNVIDSVGAPSTGSAVVEGTAIRYTPPADFEGPASFTYEIKDDADQTSSATVHVFVVAPAPLRAVAVDDGARIGYGAIFGPPPATTDAFVDVLENDVGLNRTVTNVATPSAGTATLQPDGTIHFVPPDGFAGLATFEYEVTSEDGVPDTGTVRVVVVAGSAKPDLHIGVDGTTVGDDIYDPSGATQTLVSSVARGDKVVHHVELENDGSGPGTFQLLGTSAGGAGVNVRYVVDGENVTKRFIRGRHVTPVLDPGESVHVRLVLKATAGASPGGFHAASLHVTSHTTPPAVDTVRAVVFVT